jgi:AcrR family transcriptional regulator
MRPRFDQDRSEAGVMDKSTTDTTTKGERTRASILATAVHLASTEGLEALTIGRLAEKTGMSKGGLFAHFGSKEDLQLATVEHAREIFIREVIQPSMEKPEGLHRLMATCMAWLSYVERSVFHGGCFFAACSAEFDGRPGKVRDRIAEIMKVWLERLTQMSREAKASGELSTQVEPRQLAFELNAIAMACNWEYGLFADRAAFKRARVAMEKLLAARLPKS